MQYAYAGKSNLRVSKICLGTMHFGSAADKAESFRVMDAALDMGINFFDTANVYGRSAGQGATEAIIGEWFAQGGGRRDRVVLATKVYGQMSASPGPNEVAGISAYKIRKDVHASLQRLQTDHIDLYQVHHIDRHISPEEFWGTFDNLNRAGDVLYFGTSNFPGWGLAKYQTAATQRGSLGIVSEQTQYNLLSRYPELEVIPAAKEFGIGLMPYMPLGGGLLTGKKAATAGTRTAEVENEYGLPIAQSKQLADFSALCADLGKPEFVVAIAWVLANPVVYSAIVGIRSVKHLAGMAEAAELVLSAEAMRRLDEIFDINSGRPLKKGPAPEAFAW